MRVVSYESYGATEFSIAITSYCRNITIIMSSSLCRLTLAISPRSTSSSCSATNERAAAAHAEEQSYGNWCYGGSVIGGEDGGTDGKITHGRREKTRETAAAAAPAKRPPRFSELMSNRANGTDGVKHCQTRTE